MKPVYLLLALLVGANGAEMHHGSTAAEPAAMDRNDVDLSDQVAALTKTVTQLMEKVSGMDVQIQSLLERCNEDNSDDPIMAETSLNPVLQNDTNLEERVTALEFQMANVHEDLTSLTDEVADMEEDLESQITVINADQVIQDEKLFELEDDTEALQASVTALAEIDEEHSFALNELEFRVTVLESLNGTDEAVIDALNELEGRVDSLNETAEGLTVSVTNLEESVLGLEQTDEELSSSVNELDSRVTELESLNGTSDDVADALEDLDMRLAKLELDGTIAFHARLSTTPTIPDDTLVIFDVVNVNIGDGYDGTSGEFTVPSGGAGLYYLFVHFEVDYGEVAVMAIRHNGDTLCDAYGDDEANNDNANSACGAVVVLEEGDVVDVWYDVGTDDTPLLNGGAHRNTFTGFRIAPQ